MHYSFCYDTKECPGNMVCDSKYKVCAGEKCSEDSDCDKTMYCVMKKCLPRGFPSSKKGKMLGPKQCKTESDCPRKQTCAKAEGKR